MVSILSLYVHYSATLYLFFQTNSPAVLSIHSLFYLNILFYSFISFKYYIFYSFFIIISRQHLSKITNSHNQILPTHRRRHHHHHHRKSTQSNQNPLRPPPWINCQPPQTQQKPLQNQFLSNQTESNSKISKLKN